MRKFINLLIAISAIFIFQSASAVTVINAIKCVKNPSDPYSVIVHWDFNTSPLGLGETHRETTASYCLGKNDQSAYSFYRDTENGNQAQQTLYLKKVTIDYRSAAPGETGTPHSEKVIKGADLWKHGCVRSLLPTKNALNEDKTLIAVGKVTDGELQFGCKRSG